MKRPVPPQYQQEIAKVKPSSNPLEGLVKRVEARNEAIMRQFQKACGPVRDFQGVITRI